MNSYDYQSFQDYIEERNIKLFEKNRQYDVPHTVKYGPYPLTIFPDVFDPTTGEASLLMLDCQSHLFGSDVLDLGTGCGNFSVLAAEHSRRIVATDISPVALSCAQKNFNDHGISEKIECRQGDLFEPVLDGEKFDLIIFDPPFREGIPNSQMERAVLGNVNSLLESFFTQVGTFLNQNGRILLCHGNIGNISYLNWLILVLGYKYRKIASSVNGGLEYFVYKISCR